MYNSTCFLNNETDHKSESRKQGTKISKKKKKHLHSTSLKTHLRRIPGRLPLLPLKHPSEGLQSAS